VNGFVSFDLFLLKQKLLNRSEAKNLKQKEAKRSKIIDMNFASLCFTSMRKLLKRSEAKICEKIEVKFYSEQA
jgi:hypothetical protein